MPRKIKRYSDRADCLMEVHGDLIVLKPHVYNRRHEVPEEVLCRALILRSAVEFATMHHVISRAVWDAHGRFVCYLLMVGTQLSTDDAAIEYLKKNGYAKKVPVDPRKMLKLAGMGKDWKYRTITNKNSRTRKQGK